MVSPALRSASSWLQISISFIDLESTGDQTVLSDQLAYFSVSASGSGTLTYQWQFNGIDLAGANQAVFFLSTASTTNSGIYDVVVTSSAGGWTTSQSALLTVLVTPVITAQPQGLTVAPGTNVVFSVAATGTPAPTYQWLKNGKSISGATNDHLTLGNVTTNDSGSYTVGVTNSAGGLLSSTAMLAVVASPMLKLQAPAVQGTGL